MIKGTEVHFYFLALREALLMAWRRDPITFALILALLAFLVLLLT